MKEEIIDLILQKIKQATNSSYPNICPDKVFGTYYANSVPKLKCEYRDIKQNDQAHAIVLVLESPHTHEFDFYKQGIAPAQGSTGENIKQYLKKILNKPSTKKMLKLQQNNTYDVILVNAIQLQCSLGEKTCMYRDIVFLYHWEQEKYRRDFRDRLETIVKNYCKGGIVINCCTKGEHNDSLTYHSGPVDEEYLKEIGFSFNKNVFDYENDVDTLQGIVEKEIKEVIEKESENKEKWRHFVGKHPYSWFNENNRKIKYKIKENE